MADIPGFTPEESLIIQEAERVGVLTDEDQRLIMQRADEAIANPPDPRPASLGEATRGVVSRGNLAAAGGVGGAVLGVPGGPPGAVAGGALGAAAGSAAFDSLENAAKALGIVQGDQADVGEISQSAVKEGAVDLGFGIAGNVIRPIRAFRRAQGFIYGVRSPEVKSLVAQAQRFGIDLSAVDVGGTIPKGFAKVVGLFPLTGTPIRRQFFRKQEGISEAALKMVDSMAPNASLTRETGINMFRAAEGVRKEFVDTAARLYDNFRTLANEASVKEFIPTESIREMAETVAKDIDAAKITLTDGEELANTNVAREFVAKLAKLPENISYKQYEGLTGELKDLIEKGRFNFDSKVALEAKLGLEQGLMDYSRAGIDTVGMPEAERKALADSLEAANNFYSKGIAQFQSPTAKKFTRVDKNLFRGGPDAPGTLNADELERVVVNLKSADAIKELRTLVGDDLINEVAAKRLNTAVEAATEIVTISGKDIPVISADKLAREMGIPLKGATSRQTRTQIEGLNELLKTSGISVKDLGDFVEVLRAVEEIGDPSTFVSRRVQIGGAAAILGALGVGAAATGAGGLVSAGTVAAAVIGRLGSSSIANPRVLRELTKVMDPKVGGEQLRVATIRLLNAANEVMQGEDTP